MPHPAHPWLAWRYRDCYRLEHWPDHAAALAATARHEQRCHLARASAQAAIERAAAEEKLAAVERKRTEAEEQASAVAAARIEAARQAQAAALKRAHSEQALLASTRATERDAEDVRAQRVAAAAAAQQAAQRTRELEARAASVARQVQALEQEKEAQTRAAIDQQASAARETAALVQTARELAQAQLAAAAAARARQATQAELLRAARQNACSLTQASELERERIAFESQTAQAVRMRAEAERHAILALRVKQATTRRATDAAARLSTALAIDIKSAEEAVALAEEKARRQAALADVVAARVANERDCVAALARRQAAEEADAQAQAARARATIEHALASAPRKRNPAGGSRARNAGMRRRALIAMLIGAAAVTGAGSGIDWNGVGARVSAGTATLAATPQTLQAAPLRMSLDLSKPPAALP